MSKTKNRNVSTTIREEDYQFLQEYNLQVSAALSIGIQTLKNIYLSQQSTMSHTDMELMRELMDKNRNVLKRLGEENDTY